ncbi:MAG: FtsX-like permease family protein [Acidimicrobiia bacterium]
MAAVWYRFRAEMRTRWMATIGLALLVGVAGGVVLTAAAGARRTDTAYDRMVDETRAWDVLVNPDEGTGSAIDPQDVARLPMVEEFGYITGMAVVARGADSLEELFALPSAYATPDGSALFEIGSPNLLEGRMPDPDAPDEVLLDTAAADDLGLASGDHLEAVVLTLPELAAADSDPDTLEAYQRGELGEAVDLTVTGVGITHDTLVVDEGFEQPFIAVTPAFYERHPDSEVGFWAGMARLEKGAADEAVLREAVEALAPDETIEFQSSSRVAETVDRAVRPYVVALTLFAVAIAITGLFVIGQALARQRFLEAADDLSLASIGFSRVQTLVGAALHTGIVAAGGALLAVLVAIAASPLMPIGPARQAEPNRGVAVDAVVVSAGGVALVAIVVLLGVVPAWRLVRDRAAGDRAARGGARPSPLPGALARAGAAPVAVTGIRFALESGRGRTAVPARTTLVGAIGAVITVAAALTFAASLDHLLGTPRLYGTNWDARLTTSVESEDELAELASRIEADLEADDRVAGWSKAQLSRVALDRRSVPAIGLEMVEGAVAPTVVEGRVPVGDDEIALGRRTLQQLDVDIGDTVTAAATGAGSRELEIVGRVALPGAGNYPGGDKTSIGDGALLTLAALGDLAPRFFGASYLVRFADEVDPETALADIAADFGPTGDVVEAAGVEQPADIVDYERVRATPLVLAGMLAVLGVATVAHALMTTVRRRRRDLAVLKALGFTRSQVSGAVAWQATTVALIALAIGLPIGIAAGRFAWTLLAESVGTIAEPVTPLLAVLLSVPLVIVVTNLIAGTPGWLAGRIRPGAALRSE